MHFSFFPTVRMGSPLLVTRELLQMTTAILKSVTYIQCIVFLCVSPCIYYDFKVKYYTFTCTLREQKTTGSFNTLPHSLHIAFSLTNTKTTFSVGKNQKKIEVNYLGEFTVCDYIPLYSLNIFHCSLTIATVMRVCVFYQSQRLYPHPFAPRSGSYNYTVLSLGQFGDA